MKIRKWAAAAAITFTASLAISLSVSAYAQVKLTEGDASAGHRVALLACTGCHLVESGQRFKPIYTGLPHPPNFSEIANQPGLTPASLRRHLETLPAVPKDSRMANPVLSRQDLRNVVVFIIGLRGKATSP